MLCAWEESRTVRQALERGEVADEEEKEKQSVDFLMKGYLEDEFEEMERERGWAELVDNLREDDPETPNPAGVDVDKQRRGVCWRPGTTTGLTQDQKQIIRFFYAESSSVKRNCTTCLTILCTYLGNSNILSFADFERHLQGYDLTLSCHVSFSFCWLVTFKVLSRSFLWFVFVLMHLVLWNPGP